MSAPEQLSFLTLAEREFSGGTATSAANKLTVTSFNFVPGKDFDDARDEVKEALKAPPTLFVQASMPFVLLPLNMSAITSADALLPYAQQNTGLEASDIRLSSLEGAGEPMAVCFSKKALAERMEQAGSLGAQKVKLYCRGLDVISALQELVQSGQIDKPVLYLDILSATTRLYVAAKEGVSDLGSVDTGTEGILDQVMSALGLKFPGSAAKLFYGDLYDFDDHASKLVADLSEKVRACVSSSKGKVPAPAYMYVSGLPSSRTALLCRNMAESLGLAPASASVAIDAQGATVPAYVGDTALGVSRMIESTGLGKWMVDLGEPEQDLTAIMASISKSGSATKQAAQTAPVKEEPKPAAPAPKEAPKTVAPAKEAPKPAAPAPVKEDDKALAAKPVLPKKADLRGKKFSEHVKTPGAASAATGPSISKPKAAVAAKADKAAAKGNKALVFGGIAAAAIVIIALVVFMSGGKKDTTPKPAPVVEEPVAPPPAPVETIPEPEAVDEATNPDALPALDETSVVPEEEVVPEEPVIPTTGSLSIQTNPIEAEVYIDGEFKGNSPIIINDLPVGPCTVEVRKPNYQSYSSSVEILGGQTEGLNGIVLAIERGKIGLSTLPTGIPYVITPVSSTAGVDDPALLRGNTPATLEGFKPGTYRVTYERAGWMPYERTIEVKPGQTSNSSFEYAPGTANISSTPAGAKVMVDGKQVGITPVAIGDLPEGIFEATVQLNGYEPEYLKFDISFGGSVSSDLKLLPLDRVIKRATDLDVLPTHEGGASISVPSNILAGNSGTIFIRFIISPEGLVENAEVVTGGKISATAASYIVKIARAWAFTPGTRKGIPMRVEVVMPVTLSAE